MCHRVRTPLNGILGSLELLLDADIGDDVRELAAAAFESARDLHRVFETELGAAVSSSDASRRSVSCGEFDLAARSAR